jgi:Xaa-Pro dipeptidase
VNRDRVVEILSCHDLDAVIATSPENILYASGYTTFQGVWNRFPKAAVFSPADERPILVLPVSEAGSVVDTLEQFEAVFFGRPNLQVDAPGRRLSSADERIAAHAAAAAPGFAAALKEACRRLGIKSGDRIAVDRTGAPEVLDVARAALGDHIAGFGEDIWRIARMVKTPKELRLLADAAALNEAAIDAFHAVLAQGTEVDAFRAYCEAVNHGGGTVQHWTGNSGRRAGAYREPQPERIVPGERFRFDVGLILKGYCSDLGGTTQVGATPSAEERHVYACITAGIDAGVAGARPGRRASELYRDVIGAVRAAGLTDYNCTLAGHGIGIEPRDYPVLTLPQTTMSPFLGEQFDAILEPNMVLNIECPLNVLGVGAYQHEVTLIVGDNGARLLSARREYRTV